MGLGLTVKRSGLRLSGFRAGDCRVVSGGGALSSLGVKGFSVVPVELYPWVSGSC